MTCDVRLGRILGLPCVWGERVVGHVERAVPDEKGQQVEGFIVRRGLGGAKWADRSMVEVLGDVALILKEKPVRLPKGREVLLGQVKDESGLTLGRVTDWWIDRDALNITGLEVTLGLLEDLQNGRCRVSRWTVQNAEEGLQVLLPREEWQKEVKA